MEPFNIQDINSRSDHVREVLSDVPSWITRWGITVITLFILSVFILSWIIRYPAVIASEATITTTIPSLTLIAGSSGDITNIYVKEQQKVSKNQMLAVIRNTADINDILVLDSSLKKIYSVFINEDKANHAYFPTTLHVGELQKSYSQFLSDLANYNFYLYNRYETLKGYSVNKQIFSSKLVYEQNIKKKAIVLNKLQLAEKDFARTKYLKAERVISQKDYELAESQLLDMRLQMEELNTTLEAQKGTVAGLKTQKITSAGNYETVKHDNWLALKVSFDNLVSELDLWKLHFLIISPINGKVSFFNNWTINQYIKASEIFLTIIPSDSATLVGKIIIDAKNSGKVKIGQRVNVKLYNYPYQEFGQLKGYVERVSLTSKDNQYMVAIKLPNGLKTSYGNTIPFKYDMRGHAEIVTEDISIMGRIFYRIRGLFN